MRRCLPRTLHAAVIVILFAGLSHAPAVRANESRPAVTADQAMRMLAVGNARFVAGKPEHPHADAGRRTETAQKGQRPFATIVSCSDSRVPAELVFDCGIGDVFVVRVAGNVCGLDEVGSIEYAVEHLGTPLLIVLGHSECGAVTAVATKAEVSGNVARLVEKIQPAVEAAQKSHPNLHGKALVPEAIKTNVWQSIEDMLKSSPVLRELARAGKVKIVGALYDIRDGKVAWLGPHPNQARLVATAAAANDHPQAPEAHAVGAEPAPASAPRGATTRPAARATESPPGMPVPHVAETEGPERKASPVSAPPGRDGTGGIGLLERCTAEELCRQGAAYLERDQYGVAAERFRAAMETDPSLLTAVNDLAGIHYLQRDYARAIELYNLVLARDGSHRFALRGAALVYATQKQYRRSRELLERLLASNDRDAQTWLDLGDVLFLLHDPAGARQHWSKAAEVDRTAEAVIAKARRRLKYHAAESDRLTAAGPVQR
jgi:carbonic anhydrase